MKAVFVFVTGFLAFALAPAHAATELESFDQARDLAESVVAEIAAGNTLEGVEMLRDYVIIPVAEFENMKSQIDMQLPVIEKRFGKSLGYEFLLQDELGTSIRQIVYIQKLERHAIAWRFIFYRPNDKWVLNSFMFDDMMQNWFMQ